VNGKSGFSESQLPFGFPREIDYYDPMRKLSHPEISSRRLQVHEVHCALRVPLVVVVDNVRSLYNVGSIFRTADGAMIERLVLTGYTPHPPRKEIDKTALGATKTVPHEYVRHAREAVLQWKDRGYRAFALELTDAGRPITAVEAESFPIVLVVGNEIVGVSAEALGECEGGIEIPMYGTKQSLNVSVAFGIAAFTLGEAWRGGQSKARVK